VKITLETLLKELTSRLSITLLLLLAVLTVAHAQWQVNERVWSPPRAGNFKILSHTNWPPMPGITGSIYQDCPVYFVSPGHFLVDDSELVLAQELAQQNGIVYPPPPGSGTNHFGGDTNYQPFAFTPGTNLYLIIGPTNGNQVWINASNTHSGLLYQLESIHGLSPSGPNSWIFGPILPDYGTNEIPFGNFPADRYLQTYWRGVVGSTVLSISLDPDYNLAVEPGSTNDNGTIGKFHITISPPTSAFTLVYQISGNAVPGQDYTNLQGTLSIPASATSAEIPIQPKRDGPGGTDQSVILTLVLTNGYLVDPNHYTATMKIYEPRPSGMAVAILDSGWTKLNGPSSGTNWNYFVMPESVKEALRSDGTPWTVVSDLDVATGVLTNADGTPKYPILIALAAESIRDDEIAPLANYVSRGGFVLAGSSAFTRTNTGAFRPDFALAAEMGLTCSPSSNNWIYNSNLWKAADHRLVNDIPTNGVVWRMPTSADEINWGTCQEHMTAPGYFGSHQVWQVANSTAQVLAWGDVYAYLTAKQYGNGQFIYDAALQPMVGHGGFAPGMYAYMIFRRAIEWAFQSAQKPIVKVSPWPYQYNAAFMVRHDLENFWDEISNIVGSAYIEFTNGAKGDYYFCTSEIVDKPNYADMITGMQQAVSTYGATIGPHNGGLPNPKLAVCSLNNSEIYEYWHWGPDEALDTPFGFEYASNSVAISFNQIETWLTNYQAPNPRVWVAPYFNASREDCYRIQEGLNVKITGDQKLTPFPAFTLSTQTDGKRYTLLSEPVSDWFVNGALAQSLDPWHDPGVHTTQTMQDGVDFYYKMGFLINFYCHALATGYRTYESLGAAGYLSPQYIQYGMNAQLHPKLWAANARDVYKWWLSRSTVQITLTSYPTNLTHTLAAVNITGAQDPSTAIEILAVGSGSAVVSHVLTNGAVGDTNIYRTVGYTTAQGQSLSVGTSAGVLSNDFSGTWAGLAAGLVSGPYHGNLALNSDGSFTYTPTNGFWGTECFTYQCTDTASNNFGTATVTITVSSANSTFSDDFTRCTLGSLSPWLVQSGNWSLGSGTMQGTSARADYGYCYLASNWTNYSVQADIQFPAGAYGGGIGGRLNPATGEHYAAWVYPENSPGGSNVLVLIRFTNWTTWAPLASQPLASVGTTNHTVKLALNSNHIDVYFDDLAAPKISTTDTNTVWYSSGTMSLEMWTARSGPDYIFSAQRAIVSP
jgi:hypothetical protein